MTDGTEATNQTCGFAVTRPRSRRLDITAYSVAHDAVNIIALVRLRRSRGVLPAQRVKNVPPEDSIGITSTVLPNK